MTQRIRLVRSAAPDASGGLWREDDTETDAKKFDQIHRAIFAQ
jgi:hypothetical protein